MSLIVDSRSNKTAPFQHTVTYSPTPTKSSTFQISCDGYVSNIEMRQRKETQKYVNNDKKLLSFHIERTSNIWMKWSYLPQSMAVWCDHVYMQEAKNMISLACCWLYFEWMKERMNEWMNDVVFDLPGNCFWCLSIDNEFMIFDSIYNHLRRCISHFYAILVSRLR